MRHGSRIVVSLLLVGLFVGRADLLAADQWVRVRSKNFVLVGNAKEKKIRQVAAHLEQFRAGLGTLLGLSGDPSPIPTIVVVFKDDKAFEPFKPMQGGKVLPLAGYFQPGEDVNYISLSPETAHESPYAVIFHEFVHQLVHETIPDPPVWFNEGLAEYYSTFEVGQDGKEVRIGRPIASHIRLLRTSSGFPISALLNSSRQLFSVNDRESRGYSYAQAWVFVHYLMLGNKQKRQPQFVEFVRACVDGGEEPDEHFERVFKADYETMEQELQSYVRSQSFPYSIYQLKDRLEFESEMTAESIPEAEADFYLGDLLLHCNRLNQAESYLRQALSHDPGHANAHGSFGLLRLRQNRIPEARRELEQAVRSDGVRPAARYYYVRSIMQSEDRCCDPETREIVLAQLTKVIEQMPSLAEPYNLLAYMNLTAGKDLDQAIELVKRGIMLQPRRRAFLLTLAQLQLRKEDTAAARRTIETLLASTREENLLSLAQKVMENIEEFERYKQIEAQAREQDEAAAEAVEKIEEHAGVEKTAGDATQPPAQQLTEARPPTPSRKAAGPAPGRTVTERPDCFPPFVDVTGHLKIEGTLVRVETLTGSVDLVLSAGGREYVFQTPEAGSPLVFSCRVDLGKDFDYSELHHGAAVYFHPAPGTKYAGRAIAIEILSTQPLRDR